MAILGGPGLLALAPAGRAAPSGAERPVSAGPASTVAPWSPPSARRVAAAVIDRTTASRRAGLLVLVPCLAGSPCPRAWCCASTSASPSSARCRPRLRVRATAAQAQDGFAEGILSPTEPGRGGRRRRRAARRPAAELGTSIAGLPGVAGVPRPGLPAGPGRAAAAALRGRRRRALPGRPGQRPARRRRGRHHRPRAGRPARHAARGRAGRDAASRWPATAPPRRTWSSRPRPTCCGSRSPRWSANLLMLLLFLRAVVASVRPAGHQPALAGRDARRDQPGLRPRSHPGRG